MQTVRVCLILFLATNLLFSQMLYTNEASAAENAENRQFQKVTYFELNIFKPDKKLISVKRTILKENPSITISGKPEHINKEMIEFFVKSLQSSPVASDEELNAKVSVLLSLESNTNFTGKLKYENGKEVLVKKSVVKDAETLESGAVFNVLSFGAKGDARQNDQPAIQSAIDAAIAAGGGKVFVPEGTYLLKSHIEVDANVELTGVYGKSILKLANNAGTSVIETKGVWNAPNQQHDNIKINNLVIDGNRVNQPEAPKGTGGVQHGIYLHGSKNSIIENMIIYDCQGDGIFPTVRQNSNITVRNNYIYNCLRTGITVAEGKDIKIYNNYLVNNHLDIECERSCENIEVKDNYLENIQSPIQVSAVNAYDLQKANIEGNTIYARGTENGSLGLAVIYFYNLKDVVFRNNEVLGRDEADPVISSANNIIRTQNTVNLLIEDNLFKNIKGSFYIKRDGQNKLAFKNNTIDSAGAGFIFDVYAPNTEVSGNYIRGRWFDKKHKMSGIGEVGFAIRDKGQIIKENTFVDLRFHLYNYSKSNTHTITGNIHTTTTTGGTPFAGLKWR